MQRITRWFHQRVKEENIPESEILTSVLIPSAHDDRYVPLRQAEVFFAPYMEFLSQSLTEVYRGFPNVRTQKREGKDSKNIFIDTPYLRIEYRISPLETLDQSPSIFYGALQIKQPEVHMLQAGKLHRTLLDAHPGQGFTLSYSPGDEPGFQIFHTKGNNTLLQGEALLRKMNLETPREGLAYTRYRETETKVWQKVPVELRQ